MSDSSWLSSWWLARQMVGTRRYARGALLDVGCGSAPYRGFFDVTSHTTVDWPRTLHARERIDVFASAESLPFGSETFDTVLCTEVLEHVSNPAAAIAEASRVLRPGGHFIVTTPFLYGIHESPYDFTRFTIYGLHRALERSAMDVVYSARRGGAVAVIADLTGKLGNRVTKRLLRAIHAPSSLQRVVLFALVATPQRVVATSTVFAERVMPRVANLLGGENATLGYVVVARRRR